MTQTRMARHQTLMIQMMSLMRNLNREEVIAHYVTLNHPLSKAFQN